jgi:hypothetical protein
MFRLEGRIAGRVRSWPLPDGETVLGRSSECEIVVDDPSVSRRHLAIRVAGSAIKITDLGSANGLWVGGERVHSILVEPGQWFSTGALLFTVRFDATLEPERRGEVAAETHPPASMSWTIPPIDLQDFPEELDPFEGRILRRMIRDGPWTRASLEGLLAAVAIEGRLSGAAVYRRTAAGWELLSSWGPSPDANEVDRVRGAGAPVGEWSALRLQHDALGDECVVLLRPADAVPPGLEFVAEACARIVNGER